jgi:hypothetical protein
VRQVLEEKLLGLRSAQVAQQTQGLALVSAPGSALDLAQAPAVAPAPASTNAHALPAPQPLADLLAHIARQTQPLQPAQPTSATTTPALGAGNVSAPMELKAIRNYRGTWSRLRAERRLHQALALVPQNAGPLNTQRLLHQALLLMQQASPSYLLHFMAHVEGLLALDPINQPLQTLLTTKGGEQRPKRGG